MNTLKALAAEVLDAEAAIVVRLPLQRLLTPTLLYATVASIPAYAL